MEAEKINKLAWEIFQNKTRLRFRNNLTLEEKERLITKIPEFQKYIDEAICLHNKRMERQEKNKLKKKYPLIKVQSSGKSTWMGGARTLCFVYSKNQGNFVLEGFRDEVEQYLKKNYTHYFCYMSMWHLGRSRGSWWFWKNSVGIFSPNKSGKHKDWKYTVRPYTSFYEPVNEEYKDIEKKTFLFKRMPKRWIPEFDVL